MIRSFSHLFYPFFNFKSCAFFSSQLCLLCYIEQIMKFPSHFAFSRMDILLGSPLRFVSNHLICTI